MFIITNSVNRFSCNISGISIELIGMIKFLLFYRINTIVENLVLLLEVVLTATLYLAQIYI